MTRDEYEAVKVRFVDELGVLESDVGSLKTQLAEKAEAMAAARQVLRGHLSWGRSVGYEEKVGVDDLVSAMNGGEMKEMTVAEIGLLMSDMSQHALFTLIKRALKAGRLARTGRGVYRVV